MRTLIIGGDWITKYWLADTLFNDSDEQNLIQIISDETKSDYFDSPPTLTEYSTDERIQYITTDTIKDVFSNSIEYADLKYVDNILIACDETPFIRDFIKHLEQQEFKGNVVFQSTWEVYGWVSKNKTPIDHRLNPNPETALGSVKLEQEDLFLNSKLNYVILRFAHIFGPYCEYTEEIYNTIKTGLLEQDIVVSQPASRALDLVYITDVLPVITNALSRKSAVRQIFNVGSGKERKVMHIVRAIRHLLNSESIVKIENQNLEQVENRGYHSLLDIGQTEKILDYHPGDLQKSFLQTSMWIESTLDIADKKADPLLKTYPQLNPEFWKKGEIAGQTRESINISDIERRGIPINATFNEDLAKIGFEAAIKGNREKRDDE